MKLRTISTEQLIDIAMRTLSYSTTELQLVPIRLVTAASRAARLVDGNSVEDLALETALGALLTCIVRSHCFAPVSQRRRDQHAAKVATGNLCFLAAREQARLAGYELPYPVAERDEFTILIESAADTNADELTIGKIIASFLRPAAPTQLSFSGMDQSAPIQAYVVSALTNLDDDQHANVLEICTAIKDVLASLDIHVHLPTEHTDPRLDSDIPPHEVHVVDRRQILHSDLIIMLGDYPTTGGGKELAWADSNGCLTLILASPGARVSRLIVGSSSEPQERIWHSIDHLKSIVRAFVIEHRQFLEDHARLRERRIQQYTPLVKSITSLRDSNRQSRPVRHGGITKRRVGEIAGSVHEYANATVDELARVADSLGGSLSDVLPSTSSPLASRERIPASTYRFNPRELRALEAASRLMSWDGPTVVHLLSKRVELDSVPAERYRRRYGEAEAWIELHNDDAQ